LEISSLAASRDYSTYIQMVSSCWYGYKRNFKKTPFEMDLDSHFGEILSFKWNLTVKYFQYPRSFLEINSQMARYLSVKQNSNTLVSFPSTARLI
jgi:hypothetical protein